MLLSFASAIMTLQFVMELGSVDQGRGWFPKSFIFCKFIASIVQNVKFGIKISIQIEIFKDDHESNMTPHGWGSHKYPGCHGFLIPSYQMLH